MTQVAVQLQDGTTGREAETQQQICKLHMNKYIFSWGMVLPAAASVTPYGLLVLILSEALGGRHPPPALHLLPRRRPNSVPPFTACKQVSRDIGSLCVVTGWVQEPCTRNLYSSSAY